MWTTNHDVWLVSVDGGEARKITMNLASDMQPAFSPDGKLLAIRSQRRAGFESDRWYVDIYELSSGNKRTLFALLRHSKLLPIHRWKRDHIGHIQILTTGQMKRFLEAE